MRSKAALVVLGFFLGLFLLELGLRAASAVLAVATERSRVWPPRAEGGRAFTLLCLGESTTAPTLPDDSWPRQLQGELEASAPGRFRIVNAGVDGTNSMKILARLPALLAEHRPDAVVAMLGVNDAQWFGVARDAGAAGRWYADLRLYQALRWFRHALAPPRPLADAEAEPTGYRDRVVRAIQERGLPLILMQYPGLAAAPLEERFGDSGIVVVANKPAFDEALRRGKYEDYFRDRFGGTWGHCTEQGNRLLARAAAAAVRRLPLGAAPAEPTPGKPADLARIDACFAADKSRLVLSFLDGCVRDFPRSARLLANRGVARFAKGDARGAEADFRAALAIRPDFPEASQSLAAVLAKKKPAGF